MSEPCPTSGTVSPSSVSTCTPARPDQVAAGLVPREGGLVGQGDPGAAAGQHQRGDAARGPGADHHGVVMGPGSPGQHHGDRDGACRADEVAQRPLDRGQQVGAAEFGRLVPSVNVSRTATPVTRRRSVRAGVLSARWPSDRKKAATAATPAATDRVQCCA